MNQGNRVNGPLGQLGVARKKVRPGAQPLDPAKGTPSGAFPTVLRTVGTFRPSALRTLKVFEEGGVAALASERHEPAPLLKNLINGFQRLSLWRGGQGGGALLALLTSGQSPTPLLPLRHSSDCSASCADI